MSVKVREKRGKLYLDVYRGGKRSWESLHLSLTKNKDQNKEILRLAEICRSKRETQFLTGAWDITDPVAGKISLIKYMEDFAKTYKKPTVINCCIKYVKQFHGNGVIQLLQITPKWCDDFQNFLLKQEAISRNTVAFYARILRTALNKAVANEIILKNPANHVQKISAPEPELEFLNFEEVKALAGTKLDDRYGAEVRRAFLFSCYTGLRIIDIETLAWGKITNNPMQIIKVQEKTKNAVYIPLSKSAQAILGGIEGHIADEPVFNLSSHNRRTSYYYLKDWALKANIRKNIGWHTARRTFATMALENGADIYTVSKLLGQTSIKHTTKYAKVTDRLRMEAVNALPEIPV
jgi:integrase